MSRTALHWSLALAAAVSCAAAASAQAPLLFTIDQPASAYTWSGTTTIGPLQGNPSTQFNLSGSQPVLLTGTGAQAIATGEFQAGGIATVVPDLNARVPNPVPFLPPLATITITNLAFELETGSFPIAANGHFSTLATVTVLSGMVNVVPLIGAPSQTDMTGTQSTAQAFVGTLVQNGTQLTGTSTQNTQFVFTDPATGIGATIDITGMLVARYDCVAPTAYCSAALNSTGSAAAISAQGSIRLQDQALDLIGSSLPLQSLGYFIFSRDEGFVAGFGGGQGNLCLGGQIYRLSNYIRNSGATGAVSLALPFGGLPPGATLDIGEAWRFQYWFRDSLPGGGATSNTSNGVRVTFCP